MRRCFTLCYCDGWRVGLITLPNVNGYVAVKGALKDEIFDENANIFAVCLWSTLGLWPTPCGKICCKRHAEFGFASPVGHIGPRPGSGAYPRLCDNAVPRETASVTGHDKNCFRKNPRDCLLYAGH